MLAEESAGGSGVRRGVALGGFMGAGKSTVGAIVAARLSLPFVDTDRVIEERFGPIPTQIATIGEPAFRVREREVVLALCDGEARVLATGGGVFADPALREALRRGHRLVTLTASLAALAARVGNGEGRPLWDGSVAERLARRAAGYADVDLRIDTTDRSAEAVAEEVVAWLSAT